MTVAMSASDTLPAPEVSARGRAPNSLKSTVTTVCRSVVDSRRSYPRVSLLAGVLLVAACSGGTTGLAANPTDTPSPTNAWPDTYSVEVCLARSHLNEAAAHLTKAADAAGAYDLDAAGKEFSEVASSAAEAQDELALAPTWKTGAALVTYLSAAAENLRKGAGLYKIAISEGDLDSADDALTFSKTGIARLERADLAYSSLASNVGFECLYD